VVAASLTGANMAIVHPRALDSAAPKPFFWDRSHTEGSISTAEVSQCVVSHLALFARTRSFDADKRLEKPGVKPTALFFTPSILCVVLCVVAAALGRSVLRLLGGPAVSAAAATDLPSPDAVSPPLAAVVLALAGGGQALPQLEALMVGQTVAGVRDSEEEGLVAAVAARVHGGLKALERSGYTACVTADEAVRDSVFCKAASDSVHWAGGAFATAASTRAPACHAAWGADEVAALAAAVEAASEGAVAATAEGTTLSAQSKGMGRCLVLFPPPPPLSLYIY